MVFMSNLLDGIDEALVDRADLRLVVGEPNVKAQLVILSGVPGERQAKGSVKWEEGDV